MSERKIDRRTVSGGDGTRGDKLGPRPAVRAIGFGRPQPGTSHAAKALPGRGEFVIRGAAILTMDAGIGDFARGDVHVRDGAIVAVAKEITAPAASSIDARGMICMPGFIDTHCTCGPAYAGRSSASTIPSSATSL